MLRFFLPSTILLTTLPAAADKPAPVEMTEIEDTAEACAEARDILPTSAKCSIASKLDIKGLGKAELIVIDSGDVAQYAIAIKTATKYVISERVQIVDSNCGMMKCDIVDRQVPKLRALANGTVALELAISAHHEYTDERSGKGVQVTTDRWDQASIIACGNRNGSLRCVTREWGGRHDSCKVKLGNDGSVTATCTTTDAIGL